MPLNTLRSALSNVNAPSRGVRPGSSVCQGPKVPAALISPGGTALVSIVSNGMRVPKLTCCICS